MNIKYKLDEKDYIDSAYWHSRNIYLFLYIFMGIMALSWLYPLFISGKQPDMAGIISTLVTVIIFIAIALYLPINTRARLKKLFASDKLLQLEQTCDITPDAIMISSEKGSSNLKWGDMYSVSESKGAFYLFISKNRMFVVPKRYMNEADTQELRQIAAANLPPKKVKLMKR